MKMNKKGFTLIEMLVVVAIIAVLVAIVIPVVGNSTESAKEAKDAANIRAAISVVTTKALLGTTTATKEVDLTQAEAFDKNTDLTDIGGFAKSIFTGADKVTVKYCATCNAVMIQIDSGDTYTAPSAKHTAH